MDRPNFRSSHTYQTPRGGGVVFVFVVITSSVTALCIPNSYTPSFLSLILCILLALPLAIVGFLDDIYNLSPGWRYAVQMLTAFSFVFVSPFFSRTLDMLPLLVFLVIAVTSIINFTNFMDGIDGLVAGCLSVAIITASLEISAPWPFWSLIGALLGFLFFNWSPARVFMGDVGSTFLGAIYSALLLHASTWFISFSSLSSYSLFGDACICVLRRVWNRQNIFQAHRLHLFQRLHQSGYLTPVFLYYI